MAKPCSSDGVNLPESLGWPYDLKREPMKNALVVIDIQNEYFPGGGFVLENAEEACKGAVEAIEQAKRDGWLVIGVQHVNSVDAPAFKPNTEGVKTHAHVAAAMGEAPIVVKSEADSFFNTDLEKIVRQAGITDLYLTGMMTQHCITHTALSPQARDLNVHIIAKGCAAPTKALSALALQGCALAAKLKWLIPYSPSSLIDHVVVKRLASVNVPGARVQARGTRRAPHGLRKQPRRAHCAERSRRRSSGA